MNMDAGKDTGVFIFEMYLFQFRSISEEEFYVSKNAFFFPELCSGRPGGGQKADKGPESGTSDWLRRAATPSARPIIESGGPP